MSKIPARDLVVGSIEGGLGVGGSPRLRDRDGGGEPSRLRHGSQEFPFEITEYPVDVMDFPLENRGSPPETKESSLEILESPPETGELSRSGQGVGSEE